MFACDFLTVETIFLKRIYVLFFISLATRRIEYVACSSNPDGRWVTQQARNLAMEFADEQPFRFLIHDRDTKFGRAFDDVFRAEGIEVIRTPVQARTRTLSRSVGSARFAPTASTASSSSAAAIWNTCSAPPVPLQRARPHRALQLLPPNGEPIRFPRLVCTKRIDSFH